MKNILPANGNLNLIAGRMKNNLPAIWTRLLLLSLPHQIHKKILRSAKTG
jgi:hypothetical protein